MDTKNYHITHSQKIVFVEKNKDYFIEMKNSSGGWYCQVVPVNGKSIQLGKFYWNKAQCRNIIRRFADSINVDFRE